MIPSESVRYRWKADVKWAAALAAFAAPIATAQAPSPAPAWTRGAVCYEVFVR